MQINCALITGASSGLGESLARLLAKQKVSLILTGRNKELLEKIQKDLVHFTQVEYLIADLADNMGPILKKIEEKKPDLVINNAGFGSYGLFINATDATTMIDVHIRATTLLTQTTIRTLISSQQPGTILNISSAAGYFAIPYFSLYCATKAFIRIFSEALDTEYRPQGIRILVASPGQIDTSFAQKASKGKYNVQRNWLILSQKKAAKLILKQIKEGKKSQIQDFRYRLALFFSFFFPKQWVQKKLSNTIKNRM